MVPPCDDIPDFELIRRMADQEADFATARVAWGHFYSRHQGFLLRVCSARYGYLLGLDEVTDLVQDGFLRAFERAKTFNCAEACDALVQRRKCRAWLIIIASNMVRDRFRGQPEVSLAPIDPEEAAQPGTDARAPEGELAESALLDSPDPGPPEGQVPESERLRLLKSCFALLSATEQKVLDGTMLWWQPDREDQRMPHTALQRLSEETGKSPDNIRQIRSRALRKLTKYINDRLNNEKNE